MRVPQSQAPVLQPAQLAETARSLAQVSGRFERNLKALIEPPPPPPPADPGFWSRLADRLTPSFLKGKAAVEPVPLPPALRYHTIAGNVVSTPFLPSSANNALSSLAKVLTADAITPRETRLIAALHDRLDQVVALRGALSQLDKASAQYLEERLFSPISDLLGEVRQSMPTRPAWAPSQPIMRYVEDLPRPSLQNGVCAGNQDTQGLVLLGHKAALHCDRGFGKYKHNEDAAALLCDRQGRIFIGVFDQAGGNGSREKPGFELGGGSKVAAHAFFERVKENVESRGTFDGAGAALRQATFDTHEALRQRDFGEVTTFVGAVIDGMRARFVSTGDSGALRFGADGSFKAETNTHEDPLRPNVITEAAGGWKDPICEVTDWQLDPGDWVIVASDGLLDSGLTNEEIGAVLRGCTTPEEATAALRDLAEARMATGEGKPDNLSIVVVKM